MFDLAPLCCQEVKAIIQCHDNNIVWETIASNVMSQVYMCVCVYVCECAHVQVMYMYLTCSVCHCILYVQDQVLIDWSC